MVFRVFWNRFLFNIYFWILISNQKDPVLGNLFTIICNYFSSKVISFFCHKFKFNNPYIFVTQWRNPVIFQTINFFRSNNLSLKFKWFTPSHCKDIEIRNLSLWQKFSSFALWISVLGLFRAISHPFFSILACLPKTG